MVEFKQTLNAQAAYSATKHQSKKVLPIMIALSGIIILLGLVGFIFGEDKEDWTAALFIMGLGAILLPVYFIALKLAQSSLNKSMSLLSDETTIIFTFYENELTVTEIKGDEYESRTKAKYSFLFKVEETKTQYFLYISKAQTYVIDKCNITQGTIEELNSYLYTNLVYKYKQSNK